MKTKKLLMLLVAMLLSSVSAFAQSNEPLSGDVNGDNKVDVADIVAIISALAQSTEPQNGDINGDNKVDANDIMAIITMMKNAGGTSETTHYWYVGTSTTPPTADNYTSILTQVDENENPYTFTNTNVRHYMYIVVRDTKSVPSIKNGQFDLGYGEYNNVTIPGCKVYRSNSAISLNGSLVITIE